MAPYFPKINKRIQETLIKDLPEFEAEIARFKDFEDVWLNGSDREIDTWLKVELIKTFKIEEPPLLPRHKHVHSKKGRKRKPYNNL